MRVYDKIGQLGTFAMTHDEEPSAVTRELVREEVRQMPALALTASMLPPLVDDLVVLLDRAVASRL
jgi:hypothetical protein